MFKPNNIRHYREASGLVQEELAKKLEIAPATLGQYERGTRYPSTPIWIELSKIFKVSVDELMRVETEDVRKAF